MFYYIQVLTQGLVLGILFVLVSFLGFRDGIGGFVCLEGAGFRSSQLTRLS